MRNPQQVFILNCLGPQPQLEGDHQQKRTSEKPQNPSSVSITLVKLSRYSFSGLLGLTLSFQAWFYDVPHTHTMIVKRTDTVKVWGTYWQFRLSRLLHSWFLWIRYSWWSPEKLIYLGFILKYTIFIHKRIMTSPIQLITDCTCSVPSVTRLCNSTVTRT